MKKLKLVSRRFILLIGAVALMSITLAACSNSEASQETTAPASQSAYSSYTFTTMEQLYEDTASVAERLGYDPHNSHYGSLSCTTCHESAEDGSSQMWCSSCHVGFKLPDEGWTDYPLSAFPAARK